MKNHTTDHGQRIAMIQRHAAGETYQAIAQDMGLNSYTVRKWCRRQRKQGWAGLGPHQSQNRPGLPHFQPVVKYVLLKLKRQHPGWGLDKLRLELARRASLQGYRLPKRSSIYNYLCRFYPRLREPRPAATHRPQASSERAQAVHQYWQMDFKGEYHFPHLGKVKPFNVCDEFSSAPLAGIIHDGQRGAVTMRHIQQDLRQLFSRWGLPDAIRMDRDPTWVGSSRLEFPSVLMLWLVGLDVKPHVNRAHRPTDNAQVERCNGIWVEQVARGASPSAWTDIQTATDVAWQDRRDHLPSRNPACSGRPPTQALPALLSPRRPFDLHDEPAYFDMRRVDHYLSQWRWQRVVDITGQVSLGGCNRRVSNHHKGQLVSIHFDPFQRHFYVQAIDGQVLRPFILPILDPDFILGPGSPALDVPSGGRPP